jgi:hypothetical protein
VLHAEGSVKIAKTKRYRLRRMRRLLAALFAKASW